METGYKPFLDVSNPKLRFDYRPKLLATLEKGDTKTVDVLVEEYHHFSNPANVKLFQQTNQYSPPPTDIYIAAEKGDLASVMRLVDEDQDHSLINKHKLGKFGTPLYFACRSGQLKVVQFLVGCGADSDLPQVNNSTSLHVASWYSQADVVRFLLENGANPDLKNNFGSASPYEEAKIQKDKWGILTQKVFEEVVGDKSKNHFIKAYCGDLEYFKEGNLTVDVNDPNFCGQSLLYLATLKGHYDLAVHLIEEQNANVKCLDHRNSTVLHAAAISKSKQLIRYILDQGVIPHLQDKWNRTARDIVAHIPELVQIFNEHEKQDKFEMAKKNYKWFKQYYDPSWILERDSNQKTILHIAAKEGNEKLIKFFIKKKVDFDVVVDQYGSTCLHTAVYRGHVSIARMLLQNNVRLVRNGDGFTPFEEIGRAKMVVNQDEVPISNELKQELEKLFENHLEQRKYEVGNIKFQLKLVDKDFKNELNILINHNTYWQHLVYQFDPDNPQVKVCETKRGATLPYIFRIGGVEVVNSNQPKMPVLQEIAKHMISKSIFIDFPISLQYFPISTTDTQPVVVPLKPKRVFKEEPLMTKTFEITKKDYVVVENNIRIEFPQPEETFQFRMTFLKPWMDNVIPFKIESDYKNWPQPKAFVTNWDKDYYHLCIYDKHSSHWYGNPSNPTFILTSKCGFYAFVLKEKISPDCAIYKDLLLDDYKIKVTKETVLGSEKWGGFRILFNMQIDNTPIQFIDGKYNLPENWAISYHGTNIKNVESIIRDSLVLPDTITTTGRRIVPPPNHIQRNKVCFGVSDFSGAIFLSQYLTYSASSVYAIRFKDPSTKKTYAPVLECAVKVGGFLSFASTTPSVTISLDKPEWRVTDPSMIKILSLLLIEDGVVRRE